MKSCKLFFGIVGVAAALYGGYLSLNASLTERFMMGTGSVFTFGLLTCALLLCAGIVAIAGRASKRGTLAAGVLFLLAFLVGILFHGETVWMLTLGFTSLVFAAIFLCHGVWMEKPERAY